MNTISITTIDGTINYTESEIIRFISKAREQQEKADKVVDKLYNVKRQLREFFANQEWDSGDVTISKTSVNELLDELECDRLTTKYQGTYTITGTFNIEASDEDEAQSIIADESEVSNYGAEMSIDQIETFDIEENE
jgi:ABC-type Fe3+-hydroxamate transport system substrate-binding protein